jgi:hypothetical protein
MILNQRHLPQKTLSRRNPDLSQLSTFAAAQVPDMYQWSLYSTWSSTSTILLKDLSPVSSMGITLIRRRYECDEPARKHSIAP